MKKLLIFISLLFYIVPLTEANILKGVKKVKLNNGLTVLLKQAHTQPIVTVQVWVKVGSVNEDNATFGLSHFLEHLIFKGTEKYPGQEIAERIETQGGIINAATSKEFTKFYIDIQKEGLEDSIKILADTMSNASFPADEIEKERNVVLEEIRRHGDNPGAVLFDLFSESIFQKTPYGQSILGSTSVIKNVNRNKIIDFYKKYYIPDNMVLSIVGDFDKNKTLKLIKDTFGKQKKQKLAKPPALIEPVHKKKIVRKNKNVEHEYLYAGFLGPAMNDFKGQFTGDITSIILGGGRTSRLNRKLREEKQIVYSIGSTFWTQHGSGAFVVSSVFYPEKEKEVIDNVYNEIDLLMNDGPTEEELSRAKEIIKSHWYFDQETFHEQGLILAYWHLQGKPEMIKEYIKGIDRVQKKDVTDFLKKYYSRQNFTQTFLLPKK